MLALLLAAPPCQAQIPAAPALARPAQTQTPPPSPAESRRAELTTRLDGWKVFLRPPELLAAKHLPELARIKAGLQSERDPQAFVAWESVIAFFELGLAKDLIPGYAAMPEKDKEQALRALTAQKTALAALQSKRVALGGRQDKELDALKDRIVSSRKDPQALARIYEQIRDLGATEPGLPGASLVLPGRVGGGLTQLPDGAYPAPRYLPARGSSLVPYALAGAPEQTPWWERVLGWFGSTASPAPSAPPADEAQVLAVAAKQGMPVDLVRLAYREAKRQKVDYRMVLAVMKQESRFDPNATSRIWNKRKRRWESGARGLMQIMPGTGKDLGVSDPGRLYDPATNLEAGVRYLKQMWGMFSKTTFYQLSALNPWTRADVKKAIAAYNAGPGNVQDYGGVPPFEETQNYVVRVLQNYTRYREIFPE